jgi:hypothetical protein
MEGDADADTRVVVDVEVALRPSSTARPSEVRERVTACLEKACGGRSFVAGAVPSVVLRGDEFLARHVQHARVCDIVAPEGGGRGGSAYLPAVDFWHAELRVCVATRPLHHLHPPPPPCVFLSRVTRNPSVGAGMCTT